MSIQQGQIEFLRIVGKLKALKRTGWVHNNVSEPETVASHMHRMAIMAFLVPETIDRDRCIKMALVHDLAEAIVGDITPHCGVSEEDKHSREKNAMANMVSLIDGHIGKEIMELWEEYEQNSTPEAHFVKDIDKFDMILQADEYETTQNKDLSRFFTSTEGIIKTDLFRNMDREVRIQRANRLSGQQ